MSTRDDYPSLRHFAKGPRASMDELDCAELSAALAELDGWRRLADTPDIMRQHLAMRNERGFHLQAELDALRAQVPRWVPVSERLPSEADALGGRGGKVLVRYEPTGRADLLHWAHIVGCSHWAPITIPAATPEEPAS